MFPFSTVKQSKWNTDKNKTNVGFYNIKSVSIHRYNSMISFIKNVLTLKEVTGLPFNCLTSSYVVEIWNSAP